MGGEIRNGNPGNDVHLLHPGILLSGVGGTQYGTILSTKIYDDRGTQFQRYPIVFDGLFTWDQISIVENRLSADIVNAGVSIKLGDGATLGSKIYVASNRDYSGTNPAQSLSSLFFNVKEYGALGDGSTDDTIAVQAALTACDTTGGTVFFSVGTYILSTLNISSRTTVLGTGIGTTLKLKNTTNAFMFTTRDTAAAPTSYPHDHQFRDLYFDLNKANNTTSAGAITSTKNRNAIVERCSFVNFKGNCIYFSGSAGNNVQPRIINNQFDLGDRTDGVGIKLDNGCYDSYLESNDIGRSWRGIILSNGGDGNHSLVNNWTWGHADAGTYIYQSNGVHLLQCTWDQNFGPGLVIDGSDGVVINGGKASNNSFRDTGNIFGFGVIGTTNTYSGILVQNTSTNISIANVDFRNPNTCQKCGIEVKDSSVTDVLGGSINGMLTSPISITAPALLTVDNFRGVNPKTLYAQGNITGATTFTRVNGATITAVATGNVTTTITNGTVIGDTLTLIITQDATGSRTISKPANVKLVGGAFSPTAAASAVDSWTLQWSSSAWIEISRSLNVS